MPTKTTQKNSGKKTRKAEWKRVKLGEFCDVRDGTHDTPTKQLSGHPLITSKQLKNGSILSTEYFVNSEDFNFINKRSRVDRGDILISMIGTVGDLVYVKQEPDFAIKNIGLIKPPDSLTGIFIYYFLNSSFGKEEIKKRMRGTSQMFISLGGLRDIEVNLPPLPEQKKIAEVLSAYDDLIEVNQKKIKTLETLAQTLYKEWFVKPVKDGLPDGWEEVTFEKSEIFKRAKNRIKNFKGNKMYFDTASIDGIRISKDPLIVNSKDIPSRAQFIPEKNSVWFARMSKTYKVLFFDENSDFEIENHILSSGMLGLKTDKKYFGFLCVLINSEEFHNEKDARATGSTQVSLTDDGFNTITFIKPPLNLIEKYSEIVNDYISEILSLQKQNQNLQKTRDILIPQLVGGRVEVK